VEVVDRGISGARLEGTKDGGIGGVVVIVDWVRTGGVTVESLEDLEVEVVGGKVG
jgi:hypothetical protein